MNFTAYDYSCVMAMIPESVSKRILTYASLIAYSDLFEPDSEEYGRTTEPHCTIKYGIHSDTLAEMSDALSNQDIIVATLGKTSFFERDDYVVLKIEVDSDGAHDLNEFLSKRFECTDSFPKYVPHVTIAYLKKDADYKRYTTGMFDGIQVVFDRMKVTTPSGVSGDIYLDGGAATTVKAARFHQIASKIAFDWVRQ